MSNLAYDSGTYVGRVTKSGLGKSKDKGTPYFFVSFIPIGKIDPATPGELAACLDFERTVFRYLTEGTIDYVAKDLAALEYPYDTFDQLAAEHPKHHSFIDREIRVMCKHEPYQNEMKEKWEFAFSGSGLAHEKLDPTGTKHLNAMFGKQLKSARSVNGGTSRPAPTKAATKTVDTAKEAEEVF